MLWRKAARNGRARACALGGQGSGQCHAVARRHATRGAHAPVRLVVGAASVTRSHLCARGPCCSGAD